MKPRVAPSLIPVPADSSRVEPTLERDEAPDEPRVRAVPAADVDQDSSASLLPDPAQIELPVRNARTVEVAVSPVVAAPQRGRLAGEPALEPGPLQEPPAQLLERTPRRGPESRSAPSLGPVRPAAPLPTSQPARARHPVPVPVPPIVEVERGPEVDVGMPYIEVPRRTVVAPSPVAPAREPMLGPPLHARGRIPEPPAAELERNAELGIATPLSERVDPAKAPAPNIGDTDAEGPLFRVPVEEAPPAVAATHEATVPDEPASTPAPVAVEHEPPRAKPAAAAVRADVPRIAPASAQTEPEVRAQREHTGTLSRFDDTLSRANRFLDRYPWLLPTASFLVGWIGFFLFQRGEGLARGVAIIALVGWPWLLAENLLGRWVVARSNGRLSIGVVHFVTQQIQQEILFFALPFLFGAMVMVPGQMLFMAIATAIAIAVSVDPIYLRRIAPHAGLSSALHAYCTLIAALVVLPVALHMPLDEALPLSLAITGATLLASLPRMLFAVKGWGLRLSGCVALMVTFVAIWNLRDSIPAAGLWVREARVTDRIEGLHAGPEVKTFSVAGLQSTGAVSFVRVRAPAGLSQSVAFEWRHRGELIDRIPAQISGGNEGGFRTYSRKLNFPADPRGDWRVDLVTPGGQLIERARFTVK